MENSTSIMNVLLVLAFACVVGCANAQSAKNVITYWANYTAEKYDWDLTAAGVFCYAIDGGKSLKWRQKYSWTSFCGPVGPHREAACGKCLNVSNSAFPETVKTVRIVDDCTSQSLDLEWPAFKELDKDGRGSYQGHMYLDYQFVDCHDTQIRLYSDQY